MEPEISSHSSEGPSIISITSKIILFTLGTLFLKIHFNNILVSMTSSFNHKIHFNNILVSMTSSFNQLFSLTFSIQNTCVTQSDVCQLPCPPNPPRFDCPISICRGS